jgi:hypothetical protein
MIEHRFLAQIEEGATLGEPAMTALAIDPELPLADADQALRSELFC